MMVGMQFVLSLLLAAAVGAIVWLVATRRQAAAPAVDPIQLQDLLADAVSQAHAQAAGRADLELRGVAEHLSAINREQLGAQSSLAEQSLASRQEMIERDLVARQELLDSKLTDVQTGVRTDLDRLTALVRQLGDATSQRFGEVDSSLRVHTEVTQALSSTANSLREALANSNSRGQWGERMAEDVLRRAGMTEGINYLKRTAVQGEGNGIPDFTFVLPKGQVVFMDVKFPMAAYLKYLDATTDAERSAHRAAFLRDVRARVKELAKRDYAQVDDRQAMSQVLLFLPNETINSFIHEADAGLVDEAISQHVLICSPLTLLAFLGVIRQAFDNFALEQTSNEIISLLGKFHQQWVKYSEQTDKVKRSFDSVSKNFDELTTTRRRMLERPLRQIEELRREHQLPIDGQLFALDDPSESIDDPADDAGEQTAPRLRKVHELGA